MIPFWYPMSAVLVPDPPVYATPGLLRLLFRKGPGVELIYAGDRMWPAIRHGQRFRADPVVSGAPPPPAGSVVLALSSGIPDLFRIESASGNALRVGLDSDANGSLELAAGDLLAVVRAPRRQSRRAGKNLRRLFLDLREAVSGGPEVADDPSDTVRSKYDAQAPFYAATAGSEMAENLLAWFREHVRAGGPVFVAGSGAGRECFVLAESGFAVRGVDFSPPMVEIAERKARERSLPVRFSRADLRRHEEPPGSYAGIYFTYDVYTFLPRASERIELLRRMVQWLEPGGVVFVSARRCQRAYEHFILTLQRLARLGERSACWGQSHSRWIAPDGVLRRSFVQVFTTQTIRREAAEAGLVLIEWRKNHGLLVRRAEVDRAARGK